jgi:prolycopene isomerase
MPDMQIFNSLNSMELRSLEEIRFLMLQFFKEPLSCLTLASYFITNTGQTARKHIKDPELLKVIDIECFCWSTVLADATPLINAGMVLCDRFYGGINYPRGGVGGIARLLVEGLQVWRSCVSVSEALTLLSSKRWPRNVYKKFVLSTESRGGKWLA